MGRWDMKPYGILTISNDSQTESHHSPERRGNHQMSSRTVVLLGIRDQWSSRSWAPLVIKVWEPLPLKERRITYSPRFSFLFERWCWRGRMGKQTEIALPLQLCGAVCLGQVTITGSHSDAKRKCQSNCIRSGPFCTHSQSSRKL